MFDSGMPLIMRLLFPSPHTSLPIILVQVHFGFICPKNLVPELFFSKVLFSLSVHECYHWLASAVNNLHLHSLRHLLIANFDHDMPTLTSVLDLGRCSEGGFSFTKKNNHPF